MRNGNPVATGSDNQATKMMVCHKQTGFGLHQGLREFGDSLGPRSKKLLGAPGIATRSMDATSNKRSTNEPRA